MLADLWAGKKTALTPRINPTLVGGRCVWLLVLESGCVQCTGSRCRAAQSLQGGSSHKVSSEDPWSQSRNDWSKVRHRCVDASMSTYKLLVVDAF